MNDIKIWVALVVKYYGQATLVGAESLSGVVMEITELRPWGLQSDTVVRGGFGLGGGVQAALMVFVNVDDPQNETVGANGFDPSIDLGFGPARISSKWAGMFDYLNEFVDAQKPLIRRALRQITENRVEDTLRLVQLFKEGYTNSTPFSRGEKMVFTFEIPQAGQSLIVAATLATTSARLDRYSLTSERPILPRTDNIHYAYGFVDALFDRLGTSSATNLSQDPPQRNRYHEGINDFNQLNRPNWRDAQRRTLKEHIMHNYFRDNPSQQRETRDAYISTRELASRIAYSLDHHPGRLVDWGYYPC